MTSGWWSVSFVVEREEAFRLGRWEIIETMHAGAVVRSIAVGSPRSADSEEVMSVTLELVAAGGREARGRAENLLYQARRAAGLRDKTPTVAWVTPLQDDEASSLRFLAKAEALLENEEEADLAVVAAQIHLEPRRGGVLE